MTQQELKERMMASRSSDFWWSTETIQLSRSFAGLIQLRLEEKSTSLTLSAFVAYSAHVAWLSFTEIRRMYLARYKFTLLGPLWDGVAGVRVESEDLEVENSVSLYKLTSSCGILWGLWRIYTANILERCARSTHYDAGGSSVIT